MYILGFSGPPSSGKDSIARAVNGIIERVYVMDAYIYSLAGPMREMGMRLLGLPPEDDEAYADAKRKGQLLFKRDWRDCVQCDNLRQFMISFAEEWVRPRYGRDFWARKLRLDANFMWGEDALLVIPDIGFVEEVSYFEQEVQPQNMMVVQLTREGCDFKIDSRNYCYGTNNMPLENNTSIDWAAQHIVAHMLNLGWKLEK